jgi:hypothetical protein
VGLPWAAGSGGRPDAWQFPGNLRSGRFINTAARRLPARFAYVSVRLFRQFMEWPLRRFAQRVWCTSHRGSGRWRQWGVWPRVTGGARSWPGPGVPACPRRWSRSGTLLISVLGAGSAMAAPASLAPMQMNDACAVKFTGLMRYVSNSPPRTLTPGARSAGTN